MKVLEKAKVELLVSMKVLVKPTVVEVIGSMGEEGLLMGEEVETVGQEEEMEGEEGLVKY
jgi:hypothetical protein